MWNETSRQNATDAASPAVRVSTPRIPTQAVVVLPTLNEELGLERTLSELPFDRFGDPSFPVQPVIIDGGSTDGTLEVARKWNVEVLKQTTKGKGAAVLEAIEWARQRGVPFVVVLDADATYPPSAIVPALNLLREGSDLVIGVRRPVGGAPHRLLDMIHRIGNVVLSYTASVLTGRTVLDICSGFWAVSTEKFARLEVGAAEFAIEAELILKAVRAGLEVAQIPIDYRERLGQAKLHTVQDGGSIFLSVLEFARGPTRAGRVTYAPSVPAREILSIGLIAQSRTAILECRPSEFQLANRIGLLLRRSLPGADVRVQPTVPEVDSPGSPLTAADGPSLLVPLRGSSFGDGAETYTVSIRPIEKELTIHVPSEHAAHPALLEGPAPPPVRRRLSQRLPGFRHIAVLGAVTTRMNFDPDRLQARMLSANGFRVVNVTREETVDQGGRP
jgi:glycosyltransferase involved in cell wall biosynthesis